MQAFGYEPQASAPTGQIWRADLRNQDDSYGLELRASIMERVDLGVDALYAEYRDEYRMQAVTGAAINSLPDITNRQVRVGVFAAVSFYLNAW